MILLYNLNAKIRYEKITFRKCYYLESENELSPVLEKLLQSNRRFEISAMALYTDAGSYINQGCLPDK